MMTLSRSVLQQIKTARRSRLRHVSTVEKNLPSSMGGLPSAKMRALISLYHQADTFITPKNLSQRIDEAFIPSLREDGNQIYSMFSPRQSSFKLSELKDLVEKQRMAPQATDSDRETKGGGTNDYSSSTWSGQKEKRERKVMEALYGVEGERGGQMLPGLEVLLEEQERLEKDIEADEEDRGWLEES